MTHKVLDDVADTATGTMSTPGKLATWVTAGTCTISHEGDTILTLASGDRKVIDLGVGQTLTYTATSAGTTAVWDTAVQRTRDIRF